MKIKKVLVFLMAIFCVCIISNKVFAAIPDGMSEEFKAILNENGELVITDTSEFYTKDTLLKDILHRYSNDNYYFTNDYPLEEHATECFIERREVSTNNLLESYEISIKYEEKYSEEFKKILDERGKLVITNSGYGEITDLIWIHCDLVSNKNLRFDPIYNEDWNGTTCTIQMSKIYEDNTSKMVEQHIVGIVQEEKYSEEFKNILDESGKLVITNSSSNGMRELVELYCKSFSTQTLLYSPFFPDNWNETDCMIQRIQIDENYNYKTLEQHIVGIVQEEKYSEEFKKILNNENKIIITDSVQGDKIDLVNKYCNEFTSNDFVFNLINTNEDRTKCTIGLYKKVEQEYGFLMDLVEQHVISILYEEKYSDEFKKVLNSESGILMTSTTLGEKADLLRDYLGQFSTKELIYNCNEVNEDGTLCTISISKVRDGWQYVVEQHVVKVVYKEKVSEEFKKYLNKDGNIVIKSSRDYGKEDLVWKYCNAISDYEGISFDTMYLNEDSTACTLRMYDTGENYNQRILEQHVVNIVYDKKMSDEFKNVLSKDGKFIINSVKPTNEEEWWSLSEVLFMSLREEPWSVSYEEEDLSALDLTIIDSKGCPETHRVETVFNYDKDIKKIADELLKKIPENEKFMVKDFELINYWLNGGKNETEQGAGKIDNYSGELKALAENKNFNIIVDHRMGADEEFFTLRGGIALLQYNGVTYGIRHCIEVIGNHILYVPNETESTKEALLEAIQKRVDEYAGTGKVKITAGEGTILEYYENANNKAKKELQDKINAEKEKEEPNNSLINDYEWQIEMIDSYYEEYFLASYNNPEGEHNFLKSAEGGYWFVATIDGVDYEFIVVKDSSKMIKPTHKTADLSTNIEISSTSTSIPLDTTIKAEKLTSGEEYDKIIKTLKVKDNETFDLKLYSNSLEKNITKLEDGSFEVKIPLPDKFKNKTDLKVYYVDEKENIQEYDVNIENGYAIFKTNHFSIYTLAEEKVKDDENNKNNNDKENINDNTNNDNISNNANKENNSLNPTTGDNIVLFVLILTISILGMMSILKIRKNMKK